MLLRVFASWLFFVLSVAARVGSESMCRGVGSIGVEYGKAVIG